MSFSPLVLGHRGASASFPDNSVVAFAAAVAAGADGVELDIRRMADGGLACSHDETVADGRPVLSLASADLPAEVPVLAEALDACQRLDVVNIEIKNLPGEGDFDDTEPVAAALVRLLEDRGELHDGRILVSSFHRPSIDRVRQLAPGLATGWLVLDAREPAPLIDRAATLGHAAIHPHHLFVSEALVAAAHGAGLAVNTWTCDDPDRQRWLADVGVDAIICNDPAAALRALGR
jgi:glycerophosphoryl diester phosphodiesterase